VNLEVKLFALAREAAGNGAVRVALPAGATVADLRRHLAEQYPALAPLVGQMLVAVGAEYAEDDQTLDGAAEVACIPPVSGG
jgi:molybdopterin synthase sulfur carrier subunit